MFQDYSSLLLHDPPTDFVIEVVVMVVRLLK